MRKLALTLVPLILLRSTSVFALGVGDIELHSALNQPLNAEIRLLSATPAEIQGLTVTLAPDAAFINAGVDRLGLLSQLRFKVVQKPDGSHVIKITSPQPIREPFLDFLVEVNWPSGRFIREYTVLLDFPVLEGGKPAPLDAPVTAPPSATTEPAPTPAQNTNSSVDAESPVDTTNAEDASAAAAEAPDQNGEAAAPPSKPAHRAPPQTETSSDGNYGPTQRADTLWDIALKMRPDASVSISQVMVALAKNNPQAFFSNNVNNLMAGYILRLPPVDEIRAIPKEAAVREIAGQYQRWLSVQRGGMAVPSAPDDDVAANDTVEGAAQPGKSSSGAQLKLATPETGKAGASGGSGKKLPNDTSDIATLRKELSMALEAVDANRQENAELRTRMAQLEQQLASMQRLLALKDSTLATLQNTQKNTQLNKGTAKTPVPTTTSPPPPATASVESQTTDLLGTLMGNQKLLGLLLGGFLLVSALVWVLVRRRRQSAIDSADASFAKLLQNSAVTPEGEAKQAEEAALSNAENTESSTEQELPSTVMALSSAQTDEDMIDPLAEADVYLAYKRYEQAAELIKDAIRGDPTRADLSLKLLEIYHLAKNADAFETQAETLYAELSGDSNHPLWAKAIEMGKQSAPTHPLFSKAVSVTAAANSATDFMLNTPDDMDISTDISDAAPESTTSSTDDSFTLDMPSQEFSSVDAEKPPTVTDNSIEFNLGEPLSSEETSIVAETVSAPLSNSMDFDLSLSDDIDNLSAAVNTKGDVRDAPSASNDMPLDHSAPLEFNLDAPDIAAFDGTAPDEASPASDDDLFGGLDMVGTKLDLAKAYIDMEDKEGARMLLNEVLAEGNAAQTNEAQELMRQIG